MKTWLDRIVMNAQYKVPAAEDCNKKIVKTTVHTNQSAKCRVYNKNLYNLIIKFITYNYFRASRSQASLC